MKPRERATCRYALTLLANRLLGCDVPDLADLEDDYRAECRMEGVEPMTADEIDAWIDRLCEERVKGA